MTISGFTDLPYGILRWLRYRRTGLLMKIVNPRLSSRIIDSQELQTSCSELYYLSHSESNLSPQEQQKLIPSINHREHSIHRNPKYLFRKPFVAVVNDVTVSGSNSVVFSDDGRIYSDTLDFDPHNEVFTINRIQRCLQSEIFNTPSFVLPTLTSRYTFDIGEEYDRVTVLNGVSHSYFQWIIYHLLRLRGVQRYTNETGNEVQLIVPENAPEYVYDSLDMLGYDNNLIYWHGGTAKVSELVLPSFPEPTIESLHWIRKGLTEDIDSMDGPDWIYISRQKSPHRRVANFDDIQPILQERDIQVVEMEMLSFSDQLKLSNSVKGIIGPHGAGLVNMIWNDDLSIVEIFGDTIDAPYYILSDILDHEYHSIQCCSAPNEFEARNADIIVDPNEFSLILDSVMN